MQQRSLLVVADEKNGRSDYGRFADRLRTNRATLFAMLRISKHSLVLLLLLVGCGKLKELPTAPGGPGEPIDPTATFTRVQNEIFTPTCGALGCHDPLRRQPGLLLT